MAADFSIITCVSKPDVYQSCLLNSIATVRANHNIEIIPIINNNNCYSASNALNVGIDAAKSDILIFAHQDVRLLFDWFDCLCNLLSGLPDDWGILGSAGIALDYGQHDIGRWGGALNINTVAVGSVWNSDESLNEPPYWDGIKNLMPVHCADECLFILNKKTGLRFDSLFTGFHFYGVDVCLQARAAAYSVYCAHLPIIHYGKYSASFVGDNKYWVYLRYLYHKWHLRFPELFGTHMHWCLREDHTTGEVIRRPEITSYIPISLDAGDECSIQLKAMGIGKVRLQTDKRHGLIGE